MITNETLIEVLSEIVAEWDIRHENENHQTGFTLDTSGIAQAREMLEIINRKT
jgi:hypothetical protein